MQLQPRVLGSEAGAAAVAIGDRDEVGAGGWSAGRVQGRRDAGRLQHTNIFYSVFLSFCAPSCALLYFASPCYFRGSTPLLPVG